MSHTRFVTLHSLAYLLPIIIWLGAQLELNDWTYRVQALFSQAILVSICAQIVGMSLLYFRAGEKSLPSEINAFLLMLLFPLPLLTLSWLTASMEVITLIKVLAVATLSGALAFGIRRGLMAMLPFPQYQEPVIGAFQVGLLILLWHFRHLWINWSGL